MPAAERQAIDQTETVAPRGRDELREEIRLRGSNINVQTMLATDYLNHFNEIVMTIEMAADMPDMFELTGGWAPLGYEEHFSRSNFSDRQLAMEAYACSPDDIRSHFDETVASLDELLVSGLATAKSALDEGVHDAFGPTCRGVAQSARAHIDMLSAIIHGRHEEVSTRALLDSHTLDEAQSTIDSLFET